MRLLFRVRKGEEAEHQSTYTYTQINQPLLLHNANSCPDGQFDKNSYLSAMLMISSAVQQRRQGQKVDGNKQSTATGNLQESIKTKQQQASKTTTTLSHDQALMSLQQSNQIVKTMLDATFGCMTFLRLVSDPLFSSFSIGADPPFAFTEDFFPRATSKTSRLPLPNQDPDCETMSLLRRRVSRTRIRMVREVR
jgi:hypothetical protein